MRQRNLIIEHVLSARGLQYIVGKGGGEVSLVHIRPSLAVEGFPWEELEPLLTGSLSDIPGCSGLRVSRLVVDDPAKAGGQKVLSVGEGSQHVEVPHPVHVQGGQVGQVRVGSGTGMFYQGNPTLLIPSILVLLGYLTPLP